MRRYPPSSQPPRLRASSLLLAAALALTACGGGGGGGSAPPSAPPPVAVQPAVIATQPASQSAAAGQSVTFTVAASGDGLSYQWQRDGKDIPGATGASYLLANVQALDNGASFTVVVKNAGGSVTSAAANLKVTAVGGQGTLSLLAGPLGGTGNLDGPIGRFNLPSNIAASPSGTLYLDDNVPWQALRVITQAPGQDATVATLPRQQFAIIGAVDAAGNLYENNGYQIYKRTPAGVRTFVAGNYNVGDAVFRTITSMAVDASGTLYVADGQDHTIRKVTPQGVVTTLAGSPGQAGTQDGSGDAARFTGPGKLVFDKAGNLVVGDDTVVRRVAPDGRVSTLAGVRRDSPAATSDNPAWFPGIDGLGVDAGGNVYVLSANLRRIAPDGAVSHFTAPAQAFAAPPFGSYPSMAQDGAGNLYVTSQNPAVVWRVTLAGEIGIIAGKAAQTGSADGKGAAARFANPVAWPASSLAADAQGNVFVTEGAPVRKITSGGDVSTLALPATGSSNWPIAYYAAGLTSGGDLLAYNYGTLSRVDANGNSHFLAGQTRQVTVKATLTDGVGANATFVSPAGFVLDAQGNVYCLDQYPPRFFDDPVQVFAIRRIGADGTVATLPVANLPSIRSWFVDRDGKLVMATDKGAVLRLEADNSLSTLRPAPAQSQAGASTQTVVAGDRSGNLYVADYLWSEDGEGSVLHKMTPAGADTVIAGKPGTVGVLLGSAPGSLGVVSSLAVGSDGAVYIMSENSVLKLAQ